MFHFFRQIQNAQFRKTCDQVSEDLSQHFPKLNHLCQKEYCQLEQSRVIDVLAGMIFVDRILESLIVSEECIVVYYSDGTNKRIWFRDIGVCNLTCRVFTDITLRGRWNLVGMDVKTSHSSVLTFLDFCELSAYLHRNGDTYMYSPGFNEVRAVACILAKRSGIPFKKPIAEEPTISSQRKLWNQKIVFTGPALQSW